MLFGMVNSEETIVKKIRKLLVDLTGVDNYIYDILVDNENWEEHMELLTEVFRCFTVAGHTVRLGYLEKLV